MSFSPSSCAPRPFSSPETRLPGPRWDPRDFRCSRPRRARGDQGPRARTCAVQAARGCRLRSARHRVRLFSLLTGPRLESSAPVTGDAKVDVDLGEAGVVSAPLDEERSERALLDRTGRGDRPSLRARSHQRVHHEVTVAAEDSRARPAPRGARKNVSVESSSTSPVVATRELKRRPGRMRTFLR